MANYDDYKLEDAEDAAMKNSQMAKRVMLGGAAAVAVGGTAFAASAIHGSGEPTLSQTDVAEGLGAGAVNEEVLDPVQEPVPAHTVRTENVTINEHTYEPEPDPDVNFKDSTLIYDRETGEYLGGYDTGTIDGKDFVIIDEDGDGRADVMAYDTNDDKIYQADEIIDLADNTNIPIGNAPRPIIILNEDLAYDDDMPDNNYTDEYDLAYDNPDYNNNESFAAGANDTASSEEYMAEEHGYTDDSDLLADNGTYDTVDLI